MVWIGSALSRDCVLLVCHKFLSIDVVVLEDSSRIAKDEVHIAVDVALTVELPEGMVVKSVLVAFGAATIEGGQVSVVSTAT